MIRSIGTETLKAIDQLGQLVLFTRKVILTRPATLAQWLRASHRMGTNSLSIMIISAAFVGMVLSLQGYNTLVRFGAESQLGPMVSLSILRELGPVLAGLLFAGRAGSAIAAEIALMRTTDQISSLSMMGIDPIRQVVAERFWAGVVSLPILTAIFMAVAIVSGFILANSGFGIDAGSYWSNTQLSVEFGEDLISGMIKSVFFAVIVTSIAVTNGFYAAPNVEGVGWATTNTVVLSSEMILLSDFILTALMF